MTERPLSDHGRKTLYWAGVGASVRTAFPMHRDSGQLEPRRSRGLKSEWRNVTEHCLVQVARTEVLARWIGLPDAVIPDIKMGAFLTDFNKKQEIETIKESEKPKASPVTEANT